MPSVRRRVEIITVDNIQAVEVLKIGAFLERVRRPKKNIPLRRHTKKGRSRPRSSRVPLLMCDKEAIEV